MSHHRVSPKAGFVDIAKLPRGPNGRALCRECGSEVSENRRSFCSDPCIDAWQIKTNPSYVRKLVFERDRGVCAACGLDTEAARLELLRLRKAIENPYSWSWRGAWPVSGRAFFLKCIEIGLKRPWLGRSLWQADHIIPVSEGGGECGLDNYRTLCVPCHQRATAELRRRLSSKKKNLNQGAA